MFWRNSFRILWQRIHNYRESKFHNVSFDFVILLDKIHEYNKTTRILQNQNPIGTWNSKTLSYNSYILREHIPKSIRFGRIHWMIVEICTDGYYSPSRHQSGFTSVLFRTEIMATFPDCLSMVFSIYQVGIIVQNNFRVFCPNIEIDNI